MGLATAIAAVCGVLGILVGVIFPAIYLICENCVQLPSIAAVCAVVVRRICPRRLRPRPEVIAFVSGAFALVVCLLAALMELECVFRPLFRPVHANIDRNVCLHDHVLRWIPLLSDETETDNSDESESMCPLSHPYAIDCRTLDIRCPTSDAAGDSVPTSTTGSWFCYKNASQNSGTIRDASALCSYTGCRPPPATASAIVNASHNASEPRPQASTHAWGQGQEPCIPDTQSIEESASCGSDWEAEKEARAAAVRKQKSCCWGSLLDGVDVYQLIYFCRVSCRSDLPHTSRAHESTRCGSDSFRTQEIMLYLLTDVVFMCTGSSMLYEKMYVCVSCATACSVT